VTEPAARPVRFERVLQIRPEDIDELGHVNNAVYLRWVQEIATAHWRAAAPPALQAALVWVVLRHEIDYKRPALPGDEILARTWVGAATGTRFERHTEIARRSDAVLLARATSIWCPLDAGTGRPRRIDPALHEYFQEPGRSPSA
jgi:acyl-CoA thioester hydrolase